MLPVAMSVRVPLAATIRGRGCFLALCTWVAASSTGAPAVSDEAVEEPCYRRFIRLDGAWEFRAEGSPRDAWKIVTVPSSFEEHEGPRFDGVGWYRRRIESIEAPQGFRVLLHFQASATETEVWWNGRRVGSHLGGWTPFRFDVTEAIRSDLPGQSHELVVRVDEKVGHFTQGFLPVIAPHFGGLWQSVGLWMVPETYLDDLRLWAEPLPRERALRLHLPLGGMPISEAPPLTVRARWSGESNWFALEPVEMRFQPESLVARVTVPEIRWWSPENPQLLEVEVLLGTRSPDRVRTRTAFRTVDARGPEVHLNGRPLVVRGLLNWGYSPPLTAPRAGEAVWKQELEFARQRGFNLMKFCLWVPPRRYLELADETGVLAWMEYPTWHAPLKQTNLPVLEPEFLEFFHYDRIHPSVILRSLTCETGPGADLEVLQRLYDLAHATAPGGLVVDDSSWIGWQRVHDFYDDHPYGNNHTWKATLHRLRDHIRGHGLKPLILGEAMAADTWPDLPALARSRGGQQSWWTPAAWEAMDRWVETLAQLSGQSLDALTRDSLHYAWLMRKFQAEVFRRELPYSGYVMSVLRDIPRASMGLLDSSGESKWAPGAWMFQGDTVCLLETPEDRRSFFSRERFRARVWVSHFGSEPLEKAALVLTLADEQGAVLGRLSQAHPHQNLGTLALAAELDWPLPSVDAPTPIRLEAQLQHRGGMVSNTWSFWVVPQPRPLAGPRVVQHASMATHPLRAELAGVPEFGPETPRASLVLAARLDADLARWLENGGRVLLLPDGGIHSVRLQDHWFLRGAPAVFGAPWCTQIPRRFWIELQHFDLAGPVVPTLAPLEAFDPVLLLWDTHDRDTVVTHGLVFGTRVGKGALWVSALRHDGPGNAAGRWLLDLWAGQLPTGPLPRHRLPEPVWRGIRRGLASEQRSLVEVRWRFRPETPGSATDAAWIQPAPEFLEQLPTVAIGQWWESQGYPSLDGAAWYYCVLTLPPAWVGQEVYLTFTGVDDAYELYVNGQCVGRGGDAVLRRDALSEVRSHRIDPFVHSTGSVLIAVRVVDWQGAGGIFRPVYLGTAPLAELPGLFRWAP